MSSLSTDYLNLELGARLIAVRTQLRFTQPEFAASLGLSYRAYGNYERGEREMPTALFRALCDKYGIDPLWLLCGPGNVPIHIGTRVLNTQVLTEILRMVDDWLERHRHTLRPDKKAQLICLAYEHCVVEGAIDSKRVQDMLAVAA